jgi:hypothetical protein
MVETGANVRHVCYGFGMTLSQGYMRFPFALGLVVALLGPPVSEAADRKQASDPWIASVRLIRDGALDGSGIYLKSGLVITAAHLTAAIMSRKFISHIAEGDKEIAKYFVSAVAIRDFIPAEFTSLKW